MMVGFEIDLVIENSFVDWFWFYNYHYYLPFFIKLLILWSCANLT